MAKVFNKNGYNVISTDLYNTGYGDSGIDFLTTKKRMCDWIITNPPFNLSEGFIRKAIDHHIPFALLLKSQYWHSVKRCVLFKEYQPECVLPLTWRPDFLYGIKGGAPTMECIWTVWGNSPAQITKYIPLSKPKA